MPWKMKTADKFAPSWRVAEMREETKEGEVMSPWMGMTFLSRSAGMEEEAEGTMGGARSVR